MRPAIDRIGKRYGKLLVIRRDENAEGPHAGWWCRCDCGKMASVSAKNLARLSGRRSCGVPRHDRLDQRLHGVWRNMQKRCNEEGSLNYHRYGGRGIGICREWLCPATFIEWALANGYRRGLQIDRIDNDGDYCPENCRFVTSKANNRNRENNRKVSWKGRKVTLGELSDITGIKRATLDYRIRLRGISVEDAVALPVDRMATRRWMQDNG